VLVQTLSEAESAAPISFLPKGWAGAIVLLLLLLVAGESVYTGTVTALESSKDLQWDEAKLLVDGIDPYSLFLDPTAPVPAYVNQGNLGLSQLPSSIVMFLPLAAVSFDTAKLIWIIVNFVSTFVFVFFSCRLFLRGPVPASSLAALMLLLVAGTPWWITVGNGQYGLFALALFTGALAFFERRRLKAAAVLSCLASIKYTLVLPLFALFLPRKKDTAVIVAAVLLFNAALTILAGILVHKSTLNLVEESLTIASSIAGTGAFDFFALQSRVAPELTRLVPATLSALVIALTIILFWRPNGLRSLAILSIVSLVIVYHRIYDGVVLLLMLFHLRALYLRLDRRSWKGSHLLDRLELWVGCFIIAYVFFFETLIYENLRRETFDWIENAFSILLYLYLAFLFARAFVERGAETGFGSAVIAEATTAESIRTPLERTSSSKSNSAV
jgi:hypothetical protein